MPVITNCGFIADTCVNESVKRNNRQFTYQIIYFHAGSGRFVINGRSKKINAGEIVLYRPEQQQIYSINSNDYTEVFWIYFTENRTEKLIEKYGLNQSTFYHVGISDEIKVCFMRIINECRDKDMHYVFLTSAYLIEMLTLLTRKSISYHINAENSIETSKSVIHTVRTAIDNEFCKDIDMDEYAKLCSMSKGYFITLFRQIIGIPPMEYRTILRINRAKQLLIETDHTISDIARIVGYNDSLYFSRIFKRKSGCSPKKFKSNNL